MIDDRLRGLVDLQNQLTAYLNFVKNMVDDLLGKRQQIWFQHDSTSAHFPIAIRDHFGETFLSK